MKSLKTKKSADKIFQPKIFQTGQTGGPGKAGFALAFMACMLFPLFGLSGSAEASWIQGAQFDSQAVNKDIKKIEQHAQDLQNDPQILNRTVTRLNEKIARLKTEVQTLQSQLENLKVSHAAVRAKRREASTSKAKGALRGFWKNVTSPPEGKTWREYNEERERRRMQNSK